MAGKGLTEADWRDRLHPWLTGKTKDGGKEYPGYCPLHEDPETSKTPSASFNFKKKAYNHFGGDCEGPLWRLWEKMLAAGIVKKANEKANNAKDLPSDDQVARWCERLLESNQRLGELMDQRGLSEATIQEHDLGWDGNRYTIPVRDRDGNLVNVRRYKMGAQARDKMWNIAGHGGATLYGVDCFEYDDAIVLTEGEMDCLIAREHGFNSVTTTAGVGTWRNEWSMLFKDREVYITYDCDTAGVTNAKKVAVSLTKAGARAHIVLLPLSTKGADLTDYFVMQGFTAKSFQQLLDDTPLFEGASRPETGRAEEPVDTELSETFRSDRTNRPVRTQATVMGKVWPPYSLPSQVALTCDQDWGDQCNRCPMSLMYNGSHKVDIPAHDEVLERMWDRPEDRIGEEVLRAEGIPHRCARVEIQPLGQHTVERLMVVPSVDRMDLVGERVDRMVYNVGRHNTPLNSTVSMVGVSTPDPRNAELIMHTWECQETRTSLDSFQMTPELMQALNVFRVQEGERVLDKLGDIAKDMSANVTHIYGRRDMHIAYDLVWHSVLNFPFRGSLVGKGWLEMLVLGDTRTGKSEAAEKLRQHYQAGVLTSCEGATLAGLVGGAQNLGGKKWIITWGIIPQQDRRLVVLDEASGLVDKDVIENMSEIRSSGVAKITKIAAQQTTARTRLIWISNPPKGRRINEMPRGAIDGIGELVKNPEDIARFDMAMVAASDDVKSAVINAARPPKVSHVYTSDLCSQLVLWAWSRKPEDVVWERGVQRRCLLLAEEMGHEYVPDPPLVQAENARMKLARMAVAIAARLFSHDGTGEKVVVRLAHVYAARAFLRRLYAAPSFGYAAHSAKEIHARKVADESKRECWKWLRHHMSARTALLAIINDTKFRAQDLEIFGSITKDEAQTAIVELHGMRMLRRVDRGYIKMEPELIGLLKRMDT